MKTAFRVHYNRALSWNKAASKLLDRLEFEMERTDSKTAKKMARKMNHIMADMEKRQLYDYFEDGYKFSKR